jgi:S-adenosylmethionine:tRNA ribosyltransferase-isomerase
MNHPHPWSFPRLIEADRPPELRGTPRDRVRLLVSHGDRVSDRTFNDLPALLRPGDLLVVNVSKTLPATLDASGQCGNFIVDFSTAYSPRLWLTEPRWSPSRPGPLPLHAGEKFEVAGLPARVVAPYPGIPRLLFLHLEGDVVAAMHRVGRPIRYGYLAGEYPLDAYQTVFARVAGSAEMPSAGRPFTSRLVAELARHGVDIAPIVLHAGVSSLEIDPSRPELLPLYPEPFDVPTGTVEAIRNVRARGGRVIAVGTSVVRALESAAGGGELRPMSGFTRLYIHPDRPVRTFDGLLTGLHDAKTTHLALLSAVAGAKRLALAYDHAQDHGYLWHEFGDSHLILPN